MTQGTVLDDPAHMRTAEFIEWARKILWTPVADIRSGPSEPPTDKVESISEDAPALEAGYLMRAHRRAWLRVQTAGNTPVRYIGVQSESVQKVLRILDAAPFLGEEMMAEILLPAAVATPANFGAPVSTQQRSAPDSAECAILFFPPIQQWNVSGATPWKMLFFVAAHIADAFSGSYGYTHLAVDCCVVRDRPAVEYDPCDARDGQRFAVQAGPGCGVHRVELEKVNQRPYGRLALRDLAGLGVQCPQFCQNVNGLIGQPFSVQKFFTSGTVDPGGLVCADVITRCLKPSLQKDIHSWLQTNHPKPWGVSQQLGKDEFLISPNGYALAFGLKPGKEVNEPDVPLTPNLEPLLCDA